MVFGSILENDLQSSILKFLSQNGSSEAILRVGIKNRSILVQRLPGTPKGHPQPLSEEAVPVPEEAESDPPEEPVS